VRAADPQGRQAMAAVADTGSRPGILAVDSSRLAAVAGWLPAYGSVDALPSAVADDPGPAPLPAITGDRLAVRCGTTAARRRRSLWCCSIRAPALRSGRLFGVLGAGEQTRAATVAGCSAAPGCRILRWEVPRRRTVPGVPPRPPTALW